MKDYKSIPIHPAAQVFPMLPDDELQELAADIKCNGLRESLKISDAQLIDGRNRLIACQIAGEYDEVLKNFEQGKLTFAAKTMSIIAKRRKKLKSK